MVHRIALVGSCLVALSGSVARAHVCMDAPVSRVGEGCTFASPQKVGPCGVNERGSHVTTFRPGEAISVALNETIDHPSHFRIAFNPDGDDFEDPTSVDDKRGGHPYVLLDGIVDEDGAKQTIDVTLPDVTCDRCTLQLIQVMYDKGGNGFGGNDGVAPNNDDIYYACADLVLARAASSGDAGSDASTRKDAGVDAGKTDATTHDAGGDAGARDAGTSSTPNHLGGHDEVVDTEVSDDDGGCHLGGSHRGPWSLLAVLGILWMRRRRRLG